MLGELYKYAEDNSLSAPVGFKQKNVKYYISFSKDGDFIDIEKADENAPKPMCPDIGSLANSASKSNVIVEKARVVLDLPEANGEYKSRSKNSFYMDALRSVSECDELFKPAVKGLSDEIDRIREEYARIPKCKKDDFVGLKVDGIALESRKEYLSWWQQFRQSFSPKQNSGRMRCMISGALTEPVRTVPPVRGLIAVGGHSKGDSLICFDKDAFKSYGLEQAANAAVSEEAITAVNSAVESLMDDAPVLAGAKHIHWFSSFTEHDVLRAFDFDIDFGIGEPNDDNQDDNTEDERRIRKLFDFIRNRQRPSSPKNRYYMMSLSGVNGRVMIRSYNEGSYDELCNNINEWYDDISIYENGRGCRYPKMFKLYKRLLGFVLKGGGSKSLTDSINDKLGGLSLQVLYSAVNNTPLPDSVAVRALSYIWSDLYAGSDDESFRKKNIDIHSCRLLKAWLRRKYRNEKKEDQSIMDKLNKESPSKAYHTGRLMAAYAALQRKALGDVGAGVTERYYASACSAPALAMGQLATMAQYHLSKLDQGSNVYYSRMLQEIGGKIGCEFPKTFSLEERSQFALGFYFQNEVIYGKSKEDK